MKGERIEPVRGIKELQVVSLQVIESRGYTMEEYGELVDIARAELTEQGKFAKQILDSISKEVDRKVKATLNKND